MWEILDHSSPLALVHSSFSNGQSKIFRHPIERSMSFSGRDVSFGQFEKPNSSREVRCRKALEHMWLQTFNSRREVKLLMHLGRAPKFSQWPIEKTLRFVKGNPISS
ncbi:hypothetical protein GQ457_01G002240 [Hibiscus cannabinus]